MTDKIESVNQDFLEDLRKTAEDFLQGMGEEVPDDDEIEILNELDLEDEPDFICRVCKHGAPDGIQGICEECLKEHGLL